VARLRLGVVLPVPEPPAAEIDGLRRALGDASLGRIPAHLTLVPPVNVSVERMDQVRSVILAAAGRPPIASRLGPPTTFWPATPVVYLPPDDAALPAIGAVRDAVFHSPLARSLTYDFVPHVTLADQVDLARINSALVSLADYRIDVVFDCIAVLQEEDGHRWAPIFQATFSGSWVVGRGGVELELSVASSGDASARARTGLPPGLVVTARRQGVVVGVAEGRLDPADPAGAHLIELQVTPAERGCGIGSQLLAALLSRAASDLGASRVESGLSAVADFLTHRGFTPSEGAPGGLARQL
jgi:GNAT superfamily N-acetyltransferase